MGMTAKWVLHRNLREILSLRKEEAPAFRVLKINLGAGP
jgi:hypothetical protein